MTDPRALLDRVSELLQEGKEAQAKSLLTRQLGRLLPDPPVRWSCGLEEVDDQLALRLVRKLRNGDLLPQLSLRRTREGGRAVIVGTRARLGLLPPAEVEHLIALGEDAKLYTPHLLEVRADERGRLAALTIELVRPEFRYCSFCGARHTDPHLNCPDCRAKRRRTNPETAELEAGPVFFHELLETLFSEGDEG